MGRQKESAKESRKEEEKEKAKDTEERKANKRESQRTRRREKAKGRGLVEPPLLGSLEEEIKRGRRNATALGGSYKEDFTESPQGTIRDGYHAEEGTSDTSGR